MGQSSDPNWLFQDWFRFHIKRWEGSKSVQNMTMEQIGAYTKLLVLANGTLKNRIPSDKGALKYFLGLSKNDDGEEVYLRSVVPVLEKCFGRMQHNGEEVWYNDTVEEELEYKFGKSQKASLSAKGVKNAGETPQKDKPLKISGSKPVSSERINERKSVGSNERRSERSEERIFGIPEIPPFMDPKSSMYRPEMVDKTPTDNQALKEISSGSASERRYESLLSYLILKGGAGGIWKWATDPEPEFGWFGSLETRKHFFQILETARILANIEPAVPGRPEIFLDKLFSEFSKVPDFQTDLEDGILSVECGQGSVSFRLVDKPELDEVGDWDMTVQVVTGQIDDSVESLGGVYLSLGGKWDKPDGKKPKVSAGKPKAVKAKIEISVQEMAQRMVDAYGDRITDKMKGIWLDRTTKYLKSFTLEEAHEIMAKFITFMADFYAPYHDYRKAEDPINFYQQFVQPETYIKSGNWNCRPEIGVHKIEGWN